MRNLFKYTAIIFIAILLVSGLASLFQPANSINKIEEISLNKLTQEINDGSVSSLEVIGTIIKIDLKDGETKQTSKTEPGAPLSDTLANLGVKEEALQKVNIKFTQDNGFWAYFGEIFRFLFPFALIGVLIWFMLRQAQKGASNALNFGKSRAKLAGTDDNKKKVFFKDIAGLEEVKEEVSEVVQFLKSPSKFHKLGAKIPRGILLIGSPGTGKTLIAKAVANEANVPFHFVSGSEFVEMFVGVGATRVRDTFDAAKKTAPAIIFIDEIDAVGRHRGAGLGGGHDEREQTLNQILVEMDGFNTNETIIVIAATNRPDILDPALMRPGRFDRRIVLSEPTISDREAILKLHSEGKPIASGVNLRVVAERTPGFSGADLANIINEGAILAARNAQTEITQDNLLKAIEKVMLGPEKRSQVFNKKEKEIAAYHEAGHALVAALIPDMDPVHKVSIISRGRAGGYTLKLPTEDRNLRSKTYFEGELAVLLGGYTAEQIIYKDITTGASNDLNVASEIARSMVTRYGMSSKLGPVVLGEKGGEVFLGREVSSGKNYSEDIAYQIDMEVRKLLNQAMKKAKSIITQNITKLEKIGKELIKKEVLEQGEFYALLKS